MGNCWFYQWKHNGIRKWAAWSLHEYITNYHDYFEHFLLLVFILLLICYYRLQDLGTSCLQYLIINFATHKIWVPLALFFLHFPFSPLYVCVIWYVLFDIHPRSAHPDNAKWRLLIHISHHINFWCFKLCKDCVLLYQRWIDLWFSFNLK